MSIHPHFKNVLPILSLLFASWLFLNAPLVSALSVAPCPETSTVVKYDYLGACGLTKTSTFTLYTAADVSKIRIWYNTNIGTIPLNVKIIGPDGFAWSGLSTKGGCDPYQKNWCEGIVTLDQRLASGSYTVDIGSSSMCANPSGQTTLLVYGCEAILFAPYDFRYTLAGDLLTLNWDSSTGADGYLLRWGLSSGNYTDALKLDKSTQVGPFSVSDFPKIKLYAAVSAYNSSGNSLPSNEIIIDFNTAAHLTPPQQLKASLVGNMLTLNWNPVSGSSGYFLNFGNQSNQYLGKLDLGNSTQLGPFDTSPLPKGNYYLTVTAHNTNQESTYSNEVLVTLKSTGSVSTSEANVYINSVMSFSHDILSGGLTEQLQPILSAVLGKPSGTCPLVTMNANLANASDIESLLKNLPKPTIADINYGQGCTNEKNQQFSGSAQVKIDSLALDSATKTLAASLTIVTHNLTKDGKVIGDGSVSGTINANLGNMTGGAHFDLTNFLVSTGKRLSGAIDVSILDTVNTDVVLDITVSNDVHAQLALQATKINDDSYTISTKNTGSVNDFSVTLNSIVFDTKACSSYPVSGNAVFTGNGKSQTAIFDNRCDGTYSIK